MKKAKGRLNFEELDNFGGADFMSDGKGFDIFSFNLRRPLEASSKGLLWFFVLVPCGVGLLWGVYKSDNLPSVIGVAGRRALGAILIETQPVGERLLEQTGTNSSDIKRDDTPTIDLRPGVADNNSDSEQGQ